MSTMLTQSVHHLPRSYIIFTLPQQRNILTLLSVCFGSQVFLNTPLHQACLHGKVPPVSILLKHKANLDIQNKVCTTCYLLLIFFSCVLSLSRQIFRHSGWRHPSSLCRITPKLRASQTPIRGRGGSQCSSSCTYGCCHSRCVLISPIYIIFFFLNTT